MEAKRFMFADEAVRAISFELTTTFDGLSGVIVL